MLKLVSSRMARAVGGCLREGLSRLLCKSGRDTAKASSRMISMRMISRIMFFSRVRFFSCSWLALMKRRVENTIRLGFFLASSQISKGRMVAAARKSKPALRKLIPPMA